LATAVQGCPTTIGLLAPSALARFFVNVGLGRDGLARGCVLAWGKRAPILPSL
jgi:hypothetical protein